MKQVALKISKMRKADQCSVYPASADDQGWLRFQGERLVGMVEEETGKAIINYRHGSAYPKFLHLQKGMKGREEITIDRDTISAIKEAQPKSGERICGGLFIV